MNKNVGYDFQKNKSRIPRMKKDKLIQLFNADQFSNNLGDISIIKPQDVPQHDLFTYSFPCQDISVAGNMKGIEKGKTRSGLLYECERIIEHCRPKYLLMENVKNLVGKKFKSQFEEWLQYLESLGYKNYWKVLNAKDFGIAQNRERVFVISILGDENYEFPNGFKLEKRLKDFLEESVEDKYYLSEEIQKRFKQTKIDDGNSNIIGTTAPEFRTIGQRDLVYSQEGTINQELCVFEEVKNGAIRGRYNENGIVEQQLELKSDGIVNTITGVQKDNVVIEPKINQVGMLDIKGNEQIRRVYGDNPLSPTLNTMQGGNRQPKIIEHNTVCEQRCDEGLRFFKDNVCGTIRTINSGWDKRVIETEPNFRIRKLTPKECFRLMGLSDEQIKNIQQTELSDSAQYKLAGNSIVVQVLEGIFRNLFINNK